jgi:hypothetical protein
MKSSILIAAAALVALGMAAERADARIAANLNLSTHISRSHAFTRLDYADGARHMRKFKDAGVPQRTVRRGEGYWDDHGHWHSYSSTGSPHSRHWP